MKIIDKVNLPEVAEFVGKQLAPFDTSKLDRFTLGALTTTASRGALQRTKERRSGFTEIRAPVSAEGIGEPGISVSFERLLPLAPGNAARGNGTLRGCPRAAGLRRWNSCFSVPPQESAVVGAQHRCECE